MNVLLSEQHDHAIIVLPDGSALELMRGDDPLFLASDTIGANSFRHSVRQAEKNGGKLEIGPIRYTLHKPVGADGWTSPASDPVADYHAEKTGGIPGIPTEPMPAGVRSMCNMVNKRLST